MPEIRQQLAATKLTPNAHNLLKLVCVRKQSKHRLNISHNSGDGHLGKVLKLSEVFFYPLLICHTTNN